MKKSANINEKKIDSMMNQRWHKRQKVTQTTGRNCCAAAMHLLARHWNLSCTNTHANTRANTQPQTMTHTCET